MLVLMMMLTIIMMTETVVRLPGALLVEHSGGFLSGLPWSACYLSTFSLVPLLSSIIRVLFPSATFPH